MNLSGRSRTGRRPAQRAGAEVRLRRVVSLVAGTALWLGAVGVFSADDDPARLQVTQKLALASRLMSDPAAAERITGSGNPQAVAHLDEGRVHHALAEDLLQRGDLAGARRAADDALRHLAMARHMAPDAGSRKAAAQQRQEQLLGSVERLIEAWRERSSSQALGDGSDMASALGLVEVARRLARDGRYEESTQTLSQAERHVLNGMNRTLHAATLDYTLRASNPAEEFQHELARQRGYADLLPLAVRDLKPRAEALALIDRYAETSSTLQAQALQQQRTGNITQALVHIRNAALYLQRALLAAGLVAPAATESPP